MAEIEQQNAALEPGTEEVTPEPEQTPNGEAAPWDADALISEAALAGAAEDDPTPAADDDEDVDGEDGSDSDASDEDEEPEPDEDDSADEPEPEVDPWGEGGQMRSYATMVASAPQRINEVPPKARGEVMQKVIAAAYVRGQNDTQQQFASLEQQREFVAKYDELRADSPTEFFTWADENPDDAARYWSSRGQSAGQRTPQPSRGGPETPARQEPQQDADPQVRQDATREIDRIAAIPAGAARDALIQRVQRGDFLMTTGGVSALREAIDAAAAGTATTDPKPSRQPDGPAARRQQAAATRKTVARAEEGGGKGSAGNPNPIANINDPDELIRMAVET